MNEYDNICACGQPYNGTRGQCDACTDLAEEMEWQDEEIAGM